MRSKELYLVLNIMVSAERTKFINACDEGRLFEAVIDANRDVVDWRPQV